MKPGDQQDDRDRPRHDLAAVAAPVAAPSSEDLVRYLETGVDWLWSTDAGHRFTWVSDRFEAETGIGIDAMLGRSRFSLVQEVARASRNAAAHLAELEARRAFRDFIYRIDGARPECRWVATSGFPVFDAKGRFAGYRGSGRNVTRLVEAISNPDVLGAWTPVAPVQADDAGKLMAGLDSLDQAVCYLDAADRILLFNQAFSRLFPELGHVTAVDVPFRDLIEEGVSRGVFLTDGAAPSIWQDALLAGRHGAAVWQAELKLADGRILDIRDSRLSDGGRVAVFGDITEIRARETRLREAQKRTAHLLADLETTLDAMSMGVVLLDRDLNAEIINRAFYTIWGLRPGEVRPGDPFRKLMDVNRFNGIYRVSDTHWEDYVETRLSELRIGRIAPREFTRGDGSTLIYSVVSLSGGRRLVCYFDISETKRREEEAEQARRNLASVIESLPAGVIIYDRDDRFVLANRKVHDALPAMVPAMVPGARLADAGRLAHAAGYFRHTGDEDLDALYDLDTEGWVEGWTARYRKRHAVSERRNPDGRWFKVFDTRTEDGTFVGVRVDVTEDKEREEQLRLARQSAVLADRAKSEFLANMSHEIRTPMNGVLGMAELLSRTDLDAKQATFTDIILKSGNALLTIINDILDFSKIDAGQLVLDPAPFRLAEAVEDVATLISTRAKEKDLELVVRIDPELPPILVGDVGRIRQIVTNLMGNAVKFTETGHVLMDVTGRRQGTAVVLRVRVSDTGIGIPQDKLGLVFEKFSQVDSSSTRRHEGSGLGLAISSRLVALMGGTMGVESTDGKGSTFWFEVPLDQAELDHEEQPPATDVAGARVLVVDDNEVNRTILLEQLTHWGFDACAAQDGPEGLQVLDAAASLDVGVDCVVLDFQMPGMSGADVARAIRASAIHRDVPIVLLTSVDQAVGAPQLRDVALDAQLIKPVRSAALRETLAEVIRRRKASASGSTSQGLPPVRMPAPRTPPPAPGAGRAAVAPPVVPQAGSAATPPPRQPVERHILVAEDNEVNRLVFSQILEDTGIPFTIVENGRLAVEAFAASQPAMILMDVSMPEMNGLEATVAIRRLERDRGGHVPIVGVTAHALKGDRERCIEAGMDDYLPKPVSPRALTEKVTQWFSAQQGRTARR